MCKAAVYTVESATGQVTRDTSKAPEVFLAFAPSPRPAIELLPQSEWACTNPDCQVREIVISENIVRTGTMTGAPRCPACGGRLHFNSFLQTLSLVKVSDDGEAAELPSPALA